MMIRTPLLAGLALTAGFVTSSHAAQLLNQTVDVYDSVNNDMIAGSGTPIGQFVQDNAAGVGNTVSVAVRPRDRDTGAPNLLIANRYYIDPGQSSTNAARPNLAFDIHFDPGTDAVTNFILRLTLDYNPAYGNSDPGDFTVISGPIVGFWDGTDGYYTTNQTGSHASPTTHAWNDATVPYVISNTTNHTFLPAPTGFTYDSNALGEYEIRLEALDATGTTVLASATAFAVVPEPASLALLVLGSVLMLRRGRRVA